MAHSFKDCKNEFIYGEIFKRQCFTQLGNSSNFTSICCNGVINPHKEPQRLL